MLLKQVNIHKSLINRIFSGLVLFLTLFSSACVRSSTNTGEKKDTPVPYIPVTLAAPTLVPTKTAVITQEPEKNSLDCVDNLTYLSDLTIEDGTVVAPGSTLDKRWQVKNSGTCNWDEGYELRFTGGFEMGADTTQALYPARAGSEATIQITFTAPEEPGEYRSAWSAYNPDGLAFGDPFYMYIIVE
jgi:hypothetical protein